MELVWAIFTLLLWVGLTTDWFLGIRKATQLKPGTNPPLTHLPRLSVVIPALNEAHALEASLQSVLAQDYPNLEICVLNDRSTDATGEILERMKAEHPRLRVVHISELPGGWLGKNHALHVGAAQAQGEWLLFTDADVVFHPGAFSAAVSCAVTRELEHLTALPRMVSKSPLLGSFVAVFTLLFSFGVLRASAPATNAHAGLGAFNLLRRSVYEQVGGHRLIALRPDDDMMLGKLVKQAGFKQEVVLAPELIHVEWYKSVREAVQGLNKNAFAGLFYSPAVVSLFVSALVLTHILPFVAVFTATGPTRVVCALVLANIALVYALGSRYLKLPGLYAPLHPFGAAVLVYAVFESAVKAIWRGGVSWRGTFYPLEQLKRNKV